MKPVWISFSLISIVFWVFACGGELNPQPDADVARDADEQPDSDSTDAETPRDSDPDEDQSDADPDVESDVDEPVPLRLQGRVELKNEHYETFFVSLASMHFFPTDLFSCRSAVCRDIRTFGPEEQCSITEIMQPECTPLCKTNQNCVWNDDCLTTRCQDAVLPICDPACDPGEVCGPNETCDGLECIPYPNAGTVRIGGATHQNPITCLVGDGEYTCDLVADQDFWDDGDTLFILGDGADYPDFEVSTEVPDQIEVTTDLGALASHNFSGATNLELFWEVGSNTQSMIRIRVAAVHPTEGALALECNTEDDGSFSIPAAGLAALPNDPNYWGIRVERNVEREVFLEPDVLLELKLSGPFIYQQINPK